MSRLRVIAVLTSLALALAAYFALFGTPIMDAVSRWTALSSAQALNALGARVSNAGTVVGSSAFAYTIVTECTIVGPALLFVAAVMAYPATVPRKLLGIAVGVSSLALLNLVRLVSLFYIGSYFPRYLSVTHYVLWQSAMIIVTLLLWLFWVERFARVQAR